MVSVAQRRYTRSIWRSVSETGMRITTSVLAWSGPFGLLAGIPLLTTQLQWSNGHRIAVSLSSNGPFKPSVGTDAASDTSELGVGLVRAGPRDRTRMDRGRTPFLERDPGLIRLDATPDVLGSRLRRRSTPQARSPERGIGRRPATASIRAWTTPPLPVRVRIADPAAPRPASSRSRGEG